MDLALLCWARARTRPGRPPPLWLFTDGRRLPDPLPALARLPAGHAGVVFRHDGQPGREKLAREMALLCRRRRIAMTVAGDPGLARRLGLGPHLRDSVRSPAAARGLRRRAIITASAHDAAAARRARRAGADLVFLSPAFPTASHPGARALGVVRLLRLARHAPGRAAALGGIDGVSVRRLPRRIIVAAGAIGALTP